MSKLEIAGFKLMAFLALVAVYAAVTMPPEPKHAKIAVSMPKREEKARTVILTRTNSDNKEVEQARNMLNLYADKEDIYGTIFVDNYCKLKPNRKICKKG